MKIRVPWQKLKDITKVLLVLLVLSMLLSRRAPREPGYYTCQKNSDCSSGVCIHGVCRAEKPHCGDGWCDTGEDCNNCERDCGPCKLADGEPCTWDAECNSTICLHGFCRPSSPYHGDGWCDTGEDCWTAPKDCGECRWI